jgi:hypothetical protein
MVILCQIFQIIYLCTVNVMPRYKLAILDFNANALEIRAV